MCMQSKHIRLILRTWIQYNWKREYVWMRAYRWNACLVKRSCIQVCTLKFAEITFAHLLTHFILTHIKHMSNFYALSTLIIVNACWVRVSKAPPHNIHHCIDIGTWNVLRIFASICNLTILCCDKRETLEKFCHWTVLNILLCSFIARTTCVNVCECTTVHYIPWHSISP